MTCLGLISDLGYFVFVNMFMNIGKQPKSDISPQGVFGGLVLSGQKQVPLRELRPFLFASQAWVLGLLYMPIFMVTFLAQLGGWRGQRTIPYGNFACKIRE